MARVAIVLPGSGFGGAEVHSATLAAFLVQAGHEVVVCGGSGSMTPAMLARVAAARARHIVLRLDGDRDPDRGVARLMQREIFAGAIQGYHFDFVIIASPWPDMGLGVAEAAAAAGIPCLTIFHLFRDGAAMPAYFAAVLARLRRAGQRFVTISPGVGEAVASAAGLSRELIPVIPNGVSIPASFLPSTDARQRAGRALRERLGLREDEVIVSNLARIDKQKGFEVFAQVAARAVRRNPLLHFVWIGAGREEVEFRRQLKSLGVASWVSVTGWHEDVFPVLAGADIFLQTSHYEGAPLSLLEAARLAIPLVTTVNGRLPWDDLVEGEHFHAHGKDDVAGLVESVVSLSMAPERREAMSLALASVNDALSERVMGERYHGLMQDMLAPAATPDGASPTSDGRRGRLMFLPRGSAEAALAANLAREALDLGFEQLCVALPAPFVCFVEDINDARLRIIPYEPARFEQAVPEIAAWVEGGGEVAVLLGLQDRRSWQALLQAGPAEPDSLSAVSLAPGLERGKTLRRVFSPLNEATAAGHLFGCGIQSGLILHGARLSARLVALLGKVRPGSPEQLLLAALFAEEKLALTEVGADRGELRDAQSAALTPMSTAVITAVMGAAAHKPRAAAELERSARLFTQAMRDTLFSQRLTPASITSGQFVIEDAVTMAVDEGAAVAGEAQAWADLAGTDPTPLHAAGVRVMEALARGDLLAAQTALKLTRVHQAPRSPGKPVAIITCRRVPFPVRMGSDARMVAMGRFLRARGFDVVFSCEVRQNQVAEARKKALDLRAAEGFGVDLALMNEAESRLQTWPDRGQPNWNNFCYDTVAVRMLALCEALQPEIVLVNYPHHTYLGNLGQALGARFIIDTHDRVTIRETMLHRLTARFGKDPFTVEDAELFDINSYIYDAGTNTLVEDQLISSADHILAISEKDEEYYHGLVGNRADYIPMIVEPAPFVARGDSALFIGTDNALNRLAAAFLVKALLPAIRAQHPDFTLVMVGDVCRDVPDVPGLVKRGFVEDTTRLYAEAGMALVPVFYSSGQNVKIVEAMAAGMPVVAFKTVLGRCHLQHLESGYLAVDANDFVRGVLRLIENPEERRRMGLSAQAAVARHHSAGAVSRRFDKILASLA